MKKIIIQRVKSNFWDIFYLFDWMGEYDFPFFVR